jgi:FMN phosphatase YigB (HAD superfamily)
MVRIIRRHHHPRPEVMELIEEAKAKGLKLVIYSDYGCVVEKMEALGIDPKPFYMLVAAPQLGALKPSEPCVRRLLEMVDADPKTTLFVGDRDDKDGASARAVGAKFLMIGNHDK